MKAKTLTPREVKARFAHTMLNSGTVVGHHNGSMVDIDAAMENALSKLPVTSDRYTGIRLIGCEVYARDGFVGVSMQTAVAVNYWFFR